MMWLGFQGTFLESKIDTGTWFCFYKTIHLGVFFPQVAIE